MLVLLKVKLFVIWGFIFQQFDGIILDFNMCLKSKVCCQCARQVISCKLCPSHNRRHLCLISKNISDTVAPLAISKKEKEGGEANKNRFTRKKVLEKIIIWKACLSTYLPAGAVVNDSVTRWLHYLYNIWTLVAKEIYPVA